MVVERDKWSNQTSNSVKPTIVCVMRKHCLCQHNKKRRFSQATTGPSAEKEKESWRVRETESQREGLSCVLMIV